MLQREETKKILPDRVFREGNANGFKIADPNETLRMEIAHLPVNGLRKGTVYHCYDEKDLIPYFNEKNGFRVDRGFPGLLFPGQKEWVFINKKGETGWLKLPKAFDGDGSFLEGTEPNLNLIAKFPISFGDGVSREIISVWRRDEKALQCMEWPNDFRIERGVLTKKVIPLFIVYYDYAFYGFYGDLNRKTISTSARVKSLPAWEKEIESISLIALKGDALPFDLLGLEPTVCAKLSQGISL